MIRHINKVIALLVLLTIGIPLRAMDSTSFVGPDYSISFSSSLPLYVENFMKEWTINLPLTHCSLSRILDEICHKEDVSLAEFFLDTFKLSGNTCYQLPGAKERCALISKVTKLEFARFLLNRGARVDIDEKGRVLASPMGKDTAHFHPFMYCTEGIRLVFEHPGSFGAKTNKEEHFKRAAEYLKSLNKRDAQSFDERCGKSEDFLPFLPLSERKRLVHEKKRMQCELSDGELEKIFVVGYQATIDKLFSDK